VTDPARPVTDPARPTPPRTDALTPYDEAPWLYYTARELRWAGFPIPEDIPDVAYVPKSAVSLTLGEITVCAVTKSANVSWEVSFSEPFRWLTVDIYISKDGTVSL